MRCFFYPALCSSLLEVFTTFYCHKYASFRAAISVPLILLRDCICGEILEQIND